MAGGLGEGDVGFLVVLGEGFFVLLLRVFLLSILP